MAVELQTKVLVDGLRMPEGLRWHDGRLWFSDMITKRVATCDMAGKTETVAEFDDSPSGIGFMTDGSVVVSMMWKRQLRKIDRSGAVSVYADFSHLPGERINDIVMDAKHRIYVDNNERMKDRHDSMGLDDRRDLGDSLILVDPEGRSRIAVTGDIVMPNGMVITPDMKTLILAEVFGRRLTAFTIRDDGSLADRRKFADTGEATPDGICLDAEGAVWIASPRTRECLRILEGGEITHRISLPVWAVCCRLGGPDGTTLFVAAVKSTNIKSYLADAVGRIETAEVKVPAAGW